MTTYATLKSDIADWLNDSDVDGMEATFVRLAEASIRRDVRVRAMETSATITITNGTASVPDGFISARRLILDNTTTWALDYLVPEVLYSTYIYNESGSAIAYTIEGDSLIFRPSASESAKLLYTKAFDALSDDTDTNWLLTNAYDVYLYGSLMHSAPWLKEDQRAGVWASAYRAAVDALNKQDNWGRFSGSPLKVMGQIGP